MGVRQNGGLGYDEPPVPENHPWNWEKCGIHPRGAFQEQADKEIAGRKAIQTEARQSTSQEERRIHACGKAAYLELPKASPGAGKGIHVESPETGEHVPVRGSVYEHVEQLGLHLHGLIVRAGTTATGADRSPETDATGRVFGLIPESIELRQEDGGERLFPQRRLQHGQRG